MYGGYAGKIARIDLTSGTISPVEVTKQLAENYIGGNGFAAKFLFDEVNKGVDPLGPENKYLVMTGPLAGTSVPTASRTVIAMKSPLTGSWMDSYSGGTFAPTLKFAGWDGIIIEGQSAKPVLLVIDNDQVKIVDGTPWWGMKTREAQESIKEHLGSEFDTLVIGPAGENLVPMACTIMGDNAAGRGGSGAVLGSKKLKGIAVRGTGAVKVADLAGLHEFVHEFRTKIKANPGTGQALPKFGTSGVVSTNNALGMLGTRNWREEQFEGADKINGETMLNFITKRRACYACPIGCAHVAEVPQGCYAGSSSVGPEYETIWAFGSNLGNDVFESIIYADRLCDEYGIDTVSAGSAIGFAIECFEKGLINLEDTKGLKLEFGNHEVSMELLRRIAEGKDIGLLLGQGVRAAAEKIGGDAWKYAVHAKGLEIPAHSGRGIPGMAVGYATGARGGTHQDGRPTAERIGAVDINTIEGKGSYTVKIQRMTTLQDSLGVCRMTEGFFGLTDVGEYFNRVIKLVTGMDLDKDTLYDVADRIITLEIGFNIREGLGGRGADKLPYKFSHNPIPAGPAQGRYMPEETLHKLLDEVYEARGWDKETGLPKKEMLERLNLNYVGSQLGL
ncbi:MAG: aldehyde ferredoxin oxidoreductase family protein [Bacillota bacterium]